MSEFPVEFAIICNFPSCEGAFGSEKTPVEIVSEFPVEFAIICFPAFLISVDMGKTPEEISVEFSNIVRQQFELLRLYRQQAERRGH